MKFTKINATSAILIGGKSTRFMTDKALIQFSNESISKLIFNKLNPLFTEIFLIADQKDKIPFAGANVIVDIKNDLGPIGGLYTALNYTTKEYCFLSACDMPFLSQETIQIIWNRKSDEADVIAPVWNGNIEPLAAFYNKRCFPFIKDNIQNGQLMMKGFWGDVNVNFIDLSGYLPQDQISKEFFNINTPEDYNYALSILANKKS